MSTVVKKAKEMARNKSRVVIFFGVNSVPDTEEPVTN